MGCRQQKADIFLIDPEGVIRWEHIDEDYKTRPSPKQLVEIAEAIFKK